MLSKIHFIFLVLLFDNSASFNVIYEYEYPNRTAIQRQSEVYNNQFKTEKGHFGTERFLDKYQDTPDIEEYDYYYHTPDKIVSERFWDDEKEGRDAEKYY